MFPATNSGVGGNVGFPDVCLTPAAPAPIPVPYPNLSTNSQSVGFCATVHATGVPLNNMMTKQAMTNGMNSGAAHPPGIMKPGGYTMGNPIIHACGLPAQNLLMPTNGNGYNNPIGATLIPSITNVLMCGATASETADGRLGSDPWTRELTGDEVAALRGLLGDASDDSLGFTPTVGHDDRGVRRMVVVHVRRRTLAAAAGLQPGDEVLAINGARIADAAEARSFPVGSDVTFTIRRNGCVLAVRTTRPAPERRSAIADEQVVDGLGRIEILRFFDDLSRQVANAMRTLTSAGAERFELDLRNCPGGDLDAALHLADDFLPAGLDLVTVTRNGVRRPHRTRRAQRYSQPLTVRVNSQTASAAEIFVGCLAAHDRAAVVGGPMMGKLGGQAVAGSAVRTVASITIH